MAMLDFIMEMLFLVFVVLMAMVGLLFAGVLVGGLFFLALAAGGWIMTTIQGWRAG